MPARHRYSDFWDRWEAHVAAGDDAAALLAEASDDELLALLSSRAIAESEADIDAVSIELFARLAKRREELPSGALEVLRASREAYAAAIRAQRPLNEAQALLRATGETEVGKRVAVSASTSVASTKLAYESAREHAEKVQESMAQSRVSEQLAGDASSSAAKGTVATRDLGERMRSSGHEREGLAAEDASRATQVAADEANVLARKNRDVEEGRPTRAIKDLAAQEEEA